MSNASLLEKELPSNEDAENTCLGSIILDNEVIDICVKYFGPEDLYNPFSRAVYKAMLTLRQEQKPIDPITIGEELKREGPIDSFGGVSRITQLTFGVPIISNIEEYAQAIKTHSLTRQAIRLCTNIQRDLLSDDVDPATIIGKLEQKAIHLSTALNVERKDDPIGFARVNDIVPSMREQFERYHRNEASGVKTGMDNLDTMLDGGGLQGKATYLIAGAEKSGKTSLALDWMEDIVTQQNKTALIVTLEMSKETLAKRLYSKHTGIPYYMFRPGFYDSPTDNVYTRAIEGLEKFSKYPFKITDNLFRMDAIARYCAKEVEQGFKEGNTPVGVILLDYLQLITPTGTHGNREQQVASVSRDIKLLSADLDVPIVVMSNMNRVGMAEGQEPDTYNLRDSGSLAFDAEAVMFVHNPAYVPGKPYERQEITDMVLILARQRNGPTGRIPLKFIGPYMQFMTESQYAKSFGDPKTDKRIPESKGQLFERKAEIENLWDEDDDEWSTNGN